MVIATKFGFESRLCEGKVLTPLKSVVLNEKHLFRFANRMLAFVTYFLLLIKRPKRKEKKSQKGFLLRCLTRLRVLLLRILRCDRKLNVMNFLVENECWLVDFGEQMFKSHYSG